MPVTPSMIVDLPKQRATDPQMAQTPCGLTQTRVGRRAFLFGAASIGPLSFARLGQASATSGDSGLPMPAPRQAGPSLPPILEVSRELMNDGWLFHEGDVSAAPAVGHNQTYGRAKAGNAAGAAALDFDDSDWARVRLPHDWASFQPFVSTANLSQGFRPRGVGWYRRALRLDPSDWGKRIELQFGAIATNATIWVNGSVVAHNWSGYNSIYVDLTPFARFGDDLNIIAVRADAEAMEGWWYEGAGLYRHVWLSRRAPVSIATDGVHADPRQDEAGRWRVPVVIDLQNIRDRAADVSVEAALLDAAGRVIASAKVATSVAQLGDATAKITLDVDAIKAWSIERPTLYQVRVRVLEGDVELDERFVEIGFRTLRFDPDLGFFLNGEPLKIKGVCLHQDHAGLGVAVPDSMIAWRLQRLKAMGCNAIRCSHNAPAAELLSLCDRMGLLVMNENRQFNPSPDYMAQLQWLVRRDRNHPCVILWSVFNEEPMQGTEAGLEMVRRMRAAVRLLDDSRPVTAAMNGGFFNPKNVSQVVDVTGFNYSLKDYDRYHTLNPKMPIISSEDTSAFETRGAFANDPAQNVISSYDTEAASWGDTHRRTWKAIIERPFVAGTFVWTGFDYHGEPSPKAWPVTSSYFGAMDLCGFAKTAFDIHRAHWIDDEPIVSITPHWTWPGREGQPIKILVMSNAQQVMLRLNGKSLGIKAVDRVMGVEWETPYYPGQIEAIALTDGIPVARARHETAGRPVALRLTPDRTIMAGDGEDAQPITLSAVDARGRHVPTANLETRTTVTGAAILGLGNGDPTSHEPEKGASRSLFNGLAQVIIQADASPGSIEIVAWSEGLTPARCKIRRAASAQRARTPVAVSPMPIAGWRRSALSKERPDPAAAPSDSDNNSWTFVRGSDLVKPGDGGWRTYRVQVELWKGLAANGGVLRLPQVAGRAELWIDGVKVAEKPADEPAPLEAALPAGARLRTLVLLVQAEPGRASGLLSSAKVEPR